VVIALLLLLVPLSSVVTVAAITDFARDRVFENRYSHERWLAEYALAAQRAEAPQPAQGPEAATPPGRGRGQAETPPAETTVVTTPDGRTVVLSRQQPDTPFEVGEPVDDFELYARSRNAFRLGQDLTIGPDDTVRDAAVVFGNATVSGHVVGNLVVLFGTAKILSTAVIDGDFIIVGGGATVQPGATANRDVVVVGGPFDAPAGFASGGGQIVIGSGILGGVLNEIAPYLSRGLMWGRVIVPGLPWVWGILSLVFLLYAALNLIFDRPVVACATMLQARPLTTFGSGLLVLLLVGPICVLLAVSIIGIAVVPFVICALIAGTVIGKVAVARSIGMTTIPEDPEGNRAHAARSFVLGFAVLAIAYMVPVLGLITWAITTVLGLGSAALAFMGAYRRENPTKPPEVVSVPPPPPAPGYGYATGTPASTPSAAFDASAGATPLAPPPFTPPPPPAFTSAPTPAYAAYAAPAGVASGLLVAQPRALFRDRLAAFVLDVLLVFIFALFLDGIGAAEFPIFFPMLLIYLIVFWTWKQTTMGGIICQIRLVKTDGTALTFADALVRGLAGIFSLAVLALGALWILRDPEHQGWHDKIAGTLVVKVPRNWPL
jgi:uncharacterized RDD family membrane protein YckC